MPNGIASSSPLTNTLCTPCPIQRTFASSLETKGGSGD
jgi:hypothetical protein